MERKMMEEARKIKELITGGDEVEFQIVETAKGEYALQIKSGKTTLITDAEIIPKLAREYKRLM